MGYLYLLVALVSGLIKGYYVKKTSGVAKTVNDGVWITVIRMIFCSIIAFIVVVVKSGASAFVINNNALLIYIFAAISMSLFNISYLFSLKNESYIFLNVFTLIGSVITTVLSAIFFDEPISFGDWAGMMFLLISVYIMSKYNNDIKGNFTFAGIVTVALCGISSGLVDFSQKVYVKLIGTSADIYNFYTYIISLIVLFGVFVFLKPQNVDKYEKNLDIKKVIFYIFLMSGCLFLNSLFKTMAAEILPASQIYPVLQGLNLILSAAMASICFKEKMTFKGIVGIGLAFMALIMIKFF